MKDCLVQFPIVQCNISWMEVELLKIAMILIKNRNITQSASKRYLPQPMQDSHILPQLALISKLKGLYWQCCLLEKQIQFADYYPQSFPESKPPNQ